MAKVSANMQKLIDQRDLLLKELDALRNKIAGLELGISLMDNGVSPSSSSSTKSNRGVKHILIDMLREVGTTGLNAQFAVDMASRRGISLNVGSVSSTLSRFKADDVVKFDGEKYRLSEFARVLPPASNVEVLRNAGPGWGKVAS